MRSLLPVARRLGLAYLRAMVDPRYECGIYGHFELRDWSATAKEFALQTKTFIPGNTVSSVKGRPDIPVFSLDERQSRCGVVVHPLWDARRLFEMLGWIEVTPPSTASSSPATASFPATRPLCLEVNPSMSRI